MKHEENRRLQYLGDENRFSKVSTIIIYVYIYNFMFVSESGAVEYLTGKVFAPHAFSGTRSGKLSFPG